MYKTYKTEKGAKQANRQKAINMGCTGKTKYWYSMVKHEDGRCALKRDDGRITHEELDADGWFPEKEIA